jgi:hypothetical protein
MQRSARLWIMVRAGSSKSLAETTGKMVQEGEGRSSYQAEQQLREARQKYRFSSQYGPSEAMSAASARLSSGEVAPVAD